MTVDLDVIGDKEISAIGDLTGTGIAGANGVVGIAIGSGIADGERAIGVKVPLGDEVTGGVNIEVGEVD